MYLWHNEVLGFTNYGVGWRWVGYCLVIEAYEGSGGIRLVCYNGCVSQNLSWWNWSFNRGLEFEDEGNGVDIYQKSRNRYLSTDWQMEGGQFFLPFSELSSIPLALLAWGHRFASLYFVGSLIVQQLVLYTWLYWYHDVYM